MGKGNLNSMIIGLLIFAFILMGFINSASGGWSIDILDPDPNVSQDVSVAIDSNNKVHIVYGSSSNLEGVKYVTNASPSGSWERTIIDPIILPSSSWFARRGNTSIAIDSNNKVHISYCSLEGLKYVTNASPSGSWVSIIFPTPCGHPTSIAIDSNNKVYIGFNVWDSFSKYATNESGNWEIIDLPIGDVRSIALDFSNNLHIISGESYATNKSGSWETRDLFPCVMTSNDSIAIDHNDIVHLICTDHKVFYASGDMQYMEEVDPAGCAYPSIATDSNNNVHISSGQGWAPPYEAIRYITFFNVSGGWVTTIVENDVVTNDSSIAVDSNGNLHIAYSVSGVGLKYATKSVCQYPPVRIALATPLYYSSLQDAYNAALDGDVIQTQAESLNESPNFDLNKSVTLQGGYDCGYSTVTGKTTVIGNMTISNGTVTIENFILQ